MSYLIDIAEAVKDAINDALGSSEVVAERVYVPMVKYELIEERICKVFPFNNDMTPLARNSIQSEVQINVLFGEKLNDVTDPTSEESNQFIDSLMAIAEQISFAIVPGRAYGDAKCARVEHVAVYDAAALQNHRVFVSAISVFLKRSN